jgi:hypothetical protein
VRKYKGAYSGEHGDGLCRGEWVAWQFGPHRRGARHQAGVRPGTVQPRQDRRTPKMDDGRLFRFPADAPGQAHPSAVLDWSAWNVHADPVTEAPRRPAPAATHRRRAKAVEMCNNNGHCRKFDAGTMCPSYRVTRDEQHLTRGRANTCAWPCRASSGRRLHQRGRARHDGPVRVCKGCKRDCPTGVDMAKHEGRIPAHYKARHGHTLRDRLVAHLPRYAARPAACPGC